MTSRSSHIIESISDSPFLEGMFRLAFIVLLTLVIGGAMQVVIYPFKVYDNHLYERTEVFAKVEDIRVVTSTDTDVQSSGGHPIAGAVLGGAVAGPIGLIAGGILGSEVGIEQTKQVRKVISGCYIVARVDSKTLYKNYFGYGYARLCSFLKVGDSLNLKKKIVRSNGNSEYTFDPRINPY